MQRPDTIPYRELSFHKHDSIVANGRATVAFRRPYSRWTLIEPYKIHDVFRCIASTFCRSVQNPSCIDNYYTAIAVCHVDSIRTGWNLCCLFLGLSVQECKKKERENRLLPRNWKRHLLQEVQKEIKCHSSKSYQQLTYVL